MKKGKSCLFDAKAILGEYYISRELTVRMYSEEAVVLDQYQLAPILKREGCLHCRYQDSFSMWRVG